MMCPATTIHKEIIETIETASTVLVTSHVDPDGDSIGTQLAMGRFLASLGKDVSIINQGFIPERFLSLPDIDRIINIKDYNETKSFDLVVILECSTPGRAGAVSDLFSDNIDIINIDHHPDNSGFGKVVYLNDRASAVGEIITEFLLDIGYKIDKETATLLYTAIMTDTGRFRFESTTRRTMEVAGLLIDFGAHPREIADKVYHSFSPEAMALTGRLLSHFRLLHDKKICFISLDISDFEACGASLADTEGMAEFSLFIKGVVAGALFLARCGRCRPPGS
jgi:bifunctional oligoribonuclease and PAP phosphatase NrnA